MFWILVLSYWVHLLATAVWLGGLALIAFIAWPAVVRGSLNDNHWLALQKRFTPWVNGSLVLLLITGFVQMTNNAHYDGFLNINSLWAWAILVKHIAFAGMVGISFYLQMWLHPAMSRLTLWAENRPKWAALEWQKWSQQEVRLLRINMLCAVLVLLCTAVATAIP